MSRDRALWVVVGLLVALLYFSNSPGDAHRPHSGQNRRNEPQAAEQPNAPHPVDDPALRLVPSTRSDSRSFRDHLILSVEDKEAIRLHNKYAATSPEEYFAFVADSAYPLPPWKEIARPIVCDGMEYYSGHFSIPPQNILDAPRKKTQDWATVVPGRKDTYKFKKEDEYRQDLEKSRFAITRRRYGYATNRNLEILAAGSVPYFCGFSSLPRTGTLRSLPLQFLGMVTKFPGVRVKCWPHKSAAGFPISPDAFNYTRYDLVAKKLLDYTRLFQTSSHLAKYILSATSLEFLPKTILVLWASHYTIFLTSLINGLRNLGITVEDVPRRADVYAGTGCDEAKSKTYAKGWFFFCKTEESPDITRTGIEDRIRARKFDLIIISVTDTLTYYMKSPQKDIPYFNAIVENYPRDRVVTINDADLIRSMQSDIAHKMMHNMSLYFKRETHGCNEYIDFRRDRPPR